MALDARSRSSIYQNLVPILGEHDANVLMSEFPSVEAEELVTKQFLGAELAGSPKTGTGYAVDFTDVSTVGLESSPYAEALAGLRAHEARYLKNKYDHVFTVEPARAAKAAVDWVHRILEEERNIVIASTPLEATAFEVEHIKMAYVFYESGLSINVMYGLDEGGKRAVGFKLSVGMDVPEELSSFKFARQKSKLAGVIRGSYFVIKHEH